MEERVVHISVRGVDADLIPRDPRANSAGAVLRYLLRRLRLPCGFHVEMAKGVPPGRGLGSSGASAAAAAYAAMRLLDLRLPIWELVRLAAVGEEAVSGSPHADNVSASLLGGFTIVSGDYEVLRLDPPQLEIAIAVPEI
ncbi:MAG: homoserine kinase (thrB1) [Candidatus Bathyarchaeota archaeon B23]|nr:MAG: homoserine kinase (thrB1) [Candidatus Bathyarchaeota archaeon B23]